MKCFEFIRCANLLKQGISIDLAGGNPRMRIPPISEARIAPSHTVYTTDLPMPVLAEQLAARVRAQTSDEAFRQREVRLLACDLVERAEFWALPETEETKNDALLLAVWLDAKPCNPVVQTEGPVTVIAQAPAYRNIKTYRGTAQLLRLSPGAKVEFCDHPLLVRTLGFRPKVKLTLVCHPGGELKVRWKNEDHEAH